MLGHVRLVTRRRVFTLSRVLALVALGSAAVGGAPSSQAASAQLSDCQAVYGGTPTNAQCTAACNGIGCGGSWSWASPPNNSIQACNYTATYTPGTPGPRRVSKAELHAAFAGGWVVESIEPSRYEV